MDEKLVESIVDRVVEKLTAASGTGGSDAPLVTEDIRAGRVIIGISARHCHLTAEHVEVLYGPGARLTAMRMLRQVGEFAADQQVTLVGPTGRCLGPVRVLGPERKQSQVELALTDCYVLGLKKRPPVRPSGDHLDSMGITLVGPAGAVTLASGVIRANRHIHLQTTQADAMGLRDGEYVDVRVEGDRPTIFEGFQVRVTDTFRDEIHLDTDDANAAGIGPKAFGQILLKR